MFKTPTHQRWVQPPRPYPGMFMLGYYAGAFIRDPMVNFEARCLMETGEAEAFLERMWEFDNPKPDFPCPVG